MNNLYTSSIFAVLRRVYLDGYTVLNVDMLQHVVRAPTLLKKLV